MKTTNESSAFNQISAHFLNSHCPAALNKTKIIFYFGRMNSHVAHLCAVLRTAFDKSQNSFKNQTQIKRNEKYRK